MPTPAKRIMTVPLDKNLVERVKILEDKILKIEQYYPQIAAHVFNYGKAEAQASMRPGGRVSRIPGSHSSGHSTGSSRSVMRERKEMLVDVGVEDNTEFGGEEDSNSSLQELRRRMEELRSRLLRQTRGGKIKL
jgi:hypothetical protein